VPRQPRAEAASVRDLSLQTAACRCRSAPDHRSARQCDGLPAGEVAPAGRRAIYARAVEGTRRSGGV